MLAAGGGSARPLWPARLPPGPAVGCKAWQDGLPRGGTHRPWAAPSAQAAPLAGPRGHRGRSTVWPRANVGDRGGPAGQAGQRVRSGRADAERARESREAAAAPRRTPAPTAAAGCLPSAPRRGDPQPGPGDAATGSGYGALGAPPCKNQPQPACKTRSSERAYLCKLVSRQGGEQGGEERWENAGQFSAPEPRNTKKLRQGLPGEEVTATKSPATPRLLPAAGAAREGKQRGSHRGSTARFSGSVLAWPGPDGGNFGWKQPVPVGLAARAPQGISLPASELGAG